MADNSFTVQKILKVYGLDITRDALIKAENVGLVPAAKRDGTRRIWLLEDLPKIGERYGFLKKPPNPVAVAVFTTKGGVLKSTVALNLGRLAALHNIRTCIVGLDMQCDITSALGYQVDLDEVTSLQDALDRLGSVYGLADLAAKDVKLKDIIVQTDIPALSLIPETPELVSLEREISSRNLRDFWLRDHIVAPLKEQFDLVILDCSPNWNLLISNALMACDVLISPLECKINNFRNFQAFKTYLDNFKFETKKDFQHIYVPTKYASTRKLSSEIRSWYLTNVPGCISNVIRESAPGEEAMASHLSLPEYNPSSLVADEMRETILEIWSRILEQSKTIQGSARRNIKVKGDSRGEKSADARIS